MLPKIRFQVQVLKSYKSVQESSNEVSDFKSRQLARQLASSLVLTLFNYL